jgi:hypothetical protein
MGKRLIGDNLRGCPHEHHHGKGNANPFWQKYVINAKYFIIVLRFQIGEHQILGEAHSATDGHSQPVIGRQLLLQLHGRHAWHILPKCHFNILLVSSLPFFTFILFPPPLFFSKIPT